MHDLDRTQNGSSSQSYASPHPRNQTVLNQDVQMDIAADLMELETEEEFENFLGDLIPLATEAAGGTFINSPTDQALGRVLKDSAKQLLPVGQIGGEARFLGV